MIWPIGTFDTVLWDNEVTLALDHGAEVEIVEAWSYARAPALRAFSEWALALIDERNRETDEIVRAMVKHWSRALVGRFGARWPRFGEAGTLPYDDVRVWSDYDGDTGEARRILQLGRRVWRESEVRDAPDCAPAILGYVMAECRVRLWRAMLTAGLEHVLYVDTDGLLVDADGSEALRAAKLPALRPKGSWRSVEVLGPRQVVRDGALHAAGVPKSARKVGKRTFVADVWRSLETSLRRGEAGEVVIGERRQTLTGVDRRRLHLPGGATAPVRLSL